MSSHNSKMINVDFLKFVREEVPHFFSSILIQMYEDEDTPEIWTAVKEKCEAEQWYDWCIIIRDKTYLLEEKQTTMAEILRSKEFSKYILKLIENDSEV